jgi:uncharacterized HAD superfamily protein
MKIAVDIDGVLLDLMVTFCEIFNHRYNTNYGKKDVISWEFFKDWNVSEKESYEIFYKIYENSSSVPFIDESAPAILKELNAINHVDIVSARTSKYRSQLVKKLQEHDVKKGVQYVNLILVNHKPYDKKLDLKYDVYVEDNPNLVERVRKMKEKFLLLYDQPWNQYCICEENVIRVYNWNEIYENIKRLRKV